MATWKILGQDASPSTGSTGRRVAYTNGTTDGVIAWATINNRTTGAILADMFVATSTVSVNDNHVIHYRIPKEDTLETPRFTMSTGDSVLWYQATTGLSLSILGSEGISTG